MTIKPWLLVTVGMGQRTRYSKARWGQLHPNPRTIHSF